MGQFVTFSVFIHDLPIQLDIIPNGSNNKRYLFPLFSDLLHWTLFSIFSEGILTVSNFKTHQLHIKA